MDRDEYDDPLRYDAEYGDIDDAGAFFLTLAESCGPRVLDLGCGTGRIAIPLAKRGKQVIGLEHSAAMLAHARAKAGDLPIRWVEGDFRAYDLKETFDLIVSCGHAFQALLAEADQSAFLRCARAHLAPGGLLAFDTRNTAPVHLQVSGREEFWHSFTLPDGRIVDVSGIETYDPPTGVMHYRTIRTGRADGRRRETSLRIKFTAPNDLRRLARLSGLQIDRLYGDFQGGPLTPDSAEIVVVARAAQAGQSGAGA